MRTDEIDLRPAILAVDDNHTNLVALEAVLAPLEYRLVTAASGMEAVKKIREEDFVLILMDVHMPVLDGYKTVELLRTYDRAKDVPIVFLTAIYNVEAHVHRGYALGAADYVTKPIDPVVLRAKISALVSLYLRGRRTERAYREDLDRLKRLFLGAIGHDLRNPLNTIAIATQLLKDGVPTEQSRRRQIQRIERGTTRMNEIVEDILDLSQYSFAGNVTLKIETTDLAELCREAITELRTLHPSRPIELQVSCDPRGEWDPRRLARVISNLVGNAVKHATDGAVVVSVEGNDEEITLSVHNRGPAISPDLLPRVFEPFQRGESTGHGFGLGLYIVREHVRAHGGSVDVISCDTHGTTFTARLPRGATEGGGRSLVGT